MKRQFLPIIALVIFALSAWGIACASDDSTSARTHWPDTEIARALSYIRLTPDDLTLRADYVPRDSCRLVQIDSLMVNPAHSPDYLIQAATTVFADSGRGNQLRWPDLLPLIGGASVRQSFIPSISDTLRIPAEPFRQNPEWLELLPNLQIALSESGWIDTVLGGLSADDRQFVLERTPEFLLEDEADKDKSEAELDSLQKVEDAYAVRFAVIAESVRWRWIQTHGSALLHQLMPLIPSSPPRGLIAAQELQRFTTPFGDILLGTVGDDDYTGDAVLVIDPGGNDRYLLTPRAPGMNRLIIDYSGNDEYHAPEGYDIAAARFSWNVLIDREGNDTYRAGSYSLGCGWFGMGALFDLGGRDDYTGDTFTQGAGAFGIGLLYDGENGTDQYASHQFAQGFGYAAGLGILADAGGNDIYTAGGKYVSILNYTDHYYSLSQGFGYGFRPHFSGGIGLLLDQIGNDIYIADIFGQACSYWWAFGGIYDGGGNDHYIAYQYAQGSATHLTTGCLLDIAGDDRYESKGVSQGCGHDWASGMLIDLAGNDRYTATDLSQAAGSANGIGTLIDLAGDDGYYIVSPANTQGYGNPRREYGSIGLFLDLGGRDRYDGPGKDSTVWLGNSKWGVGVDAESLWLNEVEEK